MLFRSASHIASWMRESGCAKTKRPAKYESAWRSFLLRVVVSIIILNIGILNGNVNYLLVLIVRLYLKTKLFLFINNFLQSFFLLHLVHINPGPIHLFRLLIL